MDSPACTYTCLLAKLFSFSPPFSPLHLSPTLRSFLHSPLTSLPQNLPLPLFCLAFSTFPFSLLDPLASMIFSILLKITMLSLLPETYSGLLSRQTLLRVRSSSSLARSPGAKPSRPAEVSCAGHCAPQGAGLHTPAASAVVLDAVGPGKEPMFKGRMQHTRWVGSMRMLKTHCTAVKEETG